MKEPTFTPNKPTFTPNNPGDTRVDNPRIDDARPDGPDETGMRNGVIEG